MIIYFTLDDDDITILEVDGATFSWKDEEGFTNISPSNVSPSNVSSSSISLNKQNENGDFEVGQPFFLKDLTIFIEKVNIWFCC